MQRSSIARLGIASLLAAIACTGATIAAQSQEASRPAAKQGLPRTPDGKPDLQGTFDFATATPLERPAALAGKQVLTAEEAAAFEKQNLSRRASIDDAPATGQVGGYNQFWYEFGSRVVPDRRTSLIVDPADGRLPALTPDAQKRAAANRARLQRPAEGPEDRDASERCLLGYNSGPPMIPVGYNQNVQIVQTRDRVVIHNEMVHTARVVPIDGSKHLPETMRFWAGDSRGRWEGDTLVVDTTNFSKDTWNQFGGWNWSADENLHVVERFTLTDANTVEYRVTVTDPTVWTKPWTAVVPLHRTPNLMYEYACHEGNHGMVGILRGARADEQKAAQSGK